MVERLKRIEQNPKESVCDQRRLILADKQDPERSVPILVPGLPRGLGPVSRGNPLYVCLPLDVQPPEGRSRDGLLTVNLREGSRLHLCAETQDDAM